MLSEGIESTGERLFRAATATLFWPLYLPILLGKTGSKSAFQESGPATSEPADEMATLIVQVESELDTALNSLDNWAEDVLVGEQERLGELRAAWHLQAARIRELDALLSRPDFLVEPTPAPATQPPMNIDGPESPRDRARRSRQARQKNIERLRQLRQQRYDDLMGTLAWVRELVTMIHLAKFSGAPASRAEQLISQIAAAVEGLSEVTSWQTEEMLVSSP